MNRNTMPATTASTGVSCSASSPNSTSTTKMPMDAATPAAQPWAIWRSTNVTAPPPAPEDRPPQDQADAPEQQIRQVRADAGQPHQVGHQAQEEQLEAVQHPQAAPVFHDRRVVRLPENPADEIRQAARPGRHFA